MEKIVLAPLGTYMYLQHTEIFGVPVETECYGTDVIKTVISSSHYPRPTLPIQRYPRSSYLQMMLEATLQMP